MPGQYELMHGVALELSHTVQKSGFVGEHVVQRASGVCWQNPGLMDMHSVLRHCEHEVPLTQCPTAQHRMLQTSSGFVQSTGFGHTHSPSGFGATGHVHVMHFPVLPARSQALHSVRAVHAVAGLPTGQ